MRRLQLVSILFLLVACGGDEAGSTSIEVTISEFQFAPSTWSVPANEDTTIDLTNAGTMRHEWVVLGSGVQVANESELPGDEAGLAELVYFETEVEPGASETTTFTAPEPGTYQVICAIPSHFDAGMEGTLTVTEQ